MAKIIKLNQKKQSKLNLKPKAAPSKNIAKPRKSLKFNQKKQTKVDLNRKSSPLSKLSKQQKLLILCAIIALVAIAAITATLSLIGNSDNGGIGGILGGGNNGGSVDVDDGGNGGEEGGSVPEEIMQFNIARPPEKREYYVGDDPVYSGLYAYFRDGNNDAQYVYYDEDPDVFTFTGFDSSQPAEELVITVECRGFTDTFTVRIEEHPVSQAKLVGITMGTLPRTTYYIVDENTKEAFNPTGGIILAEYDDGTTVEVELNISNVSGYSSIKEPGEYTLTIKYFDDHGGYAETTMTITMKSFS